MLGSNSCKRLQLLLPSCRIVGGSVTHLHFFQKEPIFISSYSSKSSLVSGNDKLQEKVISFTVSYLINSCGLSPKLALSASKSVQFDNREGPDSVLNVLRNHGFSDDHISQLVRKRPKLLSANAEKTVVPKLEFLSSVGLSGTGLFRVLYSNPDIILKHSLERTIIPCYDIIKSLLLVDEKVALFLRSSYRVMSSKLINMVPNISVLRALEVPQASISLWVTCHPFVLSLDTEKFKENIKKVTGMGFAPSSATFMKALDVISLTDALTWDQKMEVYKKCGWTEDDFLLAFRKNPFFMSLSCKKFSSKMDFLMMGWQPADVARNPTVLTYSLEKWIIPRCSVIRVLLLKGLILKGEFSLGTIMAPEKYFLDRFVIRYQEQVPELLHILQGKIGIVELGFGF